MSTPAEQLLLSSEEKTPPCPTRLLIYTSEEYQQLSVTIVKMFSRDTFKDFSAALMKGRTTRPLLIITPDPQQNNTWLLYKISRNQTKKEMVRIELNSQLLMDSLIKDVPEVNLSENQSFMLSELKKTLEFLQSTTTLFPQRKLLNILSTTNNFNNLLWLELTVISGEIRSAFSSLEKILQQNLVHFAFRFMGGNSKQEDTDYFSLQFKWIIEGCSKLISLNLGANFYLSFKNHYLPILPKLLNDNKFLQSLNLSMNELHKIPISNLSFQNRVLRSFNLSGNSLGDLKSEILIEKAAMTGA